MIEITIAIPSELVEFLDRQAQGNRSNYIKCLLLEQHRQIVIRETITALEQDIQNPFYQAEIKEWDCVVGDGINA